MATFRYRRTAPEQMEQRASQQGGNYDSFVKDEYRTYTAKKGDNAIRILPRDESENARHYGEDIWVHYSVGPDGGSVLCPAKMANEACPLCEERARAEKRGAEEEAGELKPVRRVAMWIIDRKNEDQGPLLWAAPWTVDRDIAKATKDRETGRYYIIDDPEQGYDVYFDVDGEGRQKKYGPYQTARRPSSVDEKYLDFVVNNPLMDALRYRDYEEIRAIFEGGASKDGAKRAESTATARADREERRPPPPQDEREAKLEAKSTNGSGERAEPDKASPPWDEGAGAPAEKKSEANEALSTAAPSGAAKAASLRERFAKR